jgi:hypothetical protein
MKRIYHLHIPRTSGTSILKELIKLGDRKDTNRLRVYCPGELEFIYDDDKIRAFDIFSGHFAANPMKYDKSLVTFCLIRNPVDQYISSFKYRFFVDKITPTLELLDKYVSGYYETPGSFPAFNGSCNTQSRFISSTLARLDVEFLQINYVDFVENEPKLDEVISSTEEMIIGTLENRERAISVLNNEMTKMHGKSIKINSNKVNVTPDLRFSIPKSYMKRIEKKVSVDIELYNYILQKERTTLHA